MQVRAPASMFGVDSVALIHSVDSRVNLLTLCVECRVGAQDPGRDRLQCIPDSAGYEISGKRARWGVPKRAERINSDSSIPMPPFSPCALRATVAGFDGIAWSHASVTQKQPLIRWPDRGTSTVHIFSSFFFLRSSTTPYSPAPTPLPRRHGEGQDGGARVRKEDEEGGEGQEAAARVIIAREAAAGLDPGDWIRSSIQQADLDEPVESGLIAKGAARLPEGEMSPQPRPGECVLLATHVVRGFSLPPHPFFRGFLNFFGSQLHHFSPTPSRV